MGDSKGTVKKGPLDGITVIDFSRVLSGPYCTMVLADLGARVIKVERVGTGDDTRAFGPFVDDESGYFMCFNRGKESIALDFKSPRDRELLDRLLDKADVLVENFRPGVMDRMGYGAEQLSRSHPHIVYASISGFGHTGPYSDLPGYDIVVQAMGGVMSLTGWPDGPPSRVGPSFGDLGAGLFGIIGILAGLYKRSRDAQGTHIDIGMLDCQAALMETAFARFDVEGKVPSRTGDAHPSLAPFESFQAKDGRFIIAAGNDQLFMLMADAMEIAQIALDPRFLTNDLRVQNRPELIREIESVTGTQPVSVWLDKLNEAGVPCGPINSIDAVIENPQLHARNMIIQVEGKAGKKIRTAGNPIKMSTSPAEDISIAKRAPAVSEHKEAILAELMSASGAYRSQSGADLDGKDSFHSERSDLIA
ncbi:CaiB/BaiF CoA transferase family protein [Paraburkholderia fungorum]|uniref:CaiB/BaiF CoA transferase family protein n=1 Tax=Paraburkholderia fungorum TaxID=134537 RepID=UPI0038B9E6BE